jgi:hypothetical protein
MIKENDFTRVKNDVNGNPRYVCHYLNLNTDEEADSNMINMLWRSQGLKPLVAVNSTINNMAAVLFSNAITYGTCARESTN